MKLISIDVVIVTFTWFIILARHQLKRDLAMILKQRYSSAGPIVSCIADKYGCRKVTIFGAIFCSIAIFGSAFSTSIIWLIVTFGVLGGKCIFFCYFFIIFIFCFCFLSSFFKLSKWILTCKMAAKKKYLIISKFLTREYRNSNMALGGMSWHYSTMLTDLFPVIFSGICKYIWQFLRWLLKTD